MATIRFRAVFWRADTQALLAAVVEGASIAVVTRGAIGAWVRAQARLRIALASLVAAIRPRAVHPLALAATAHALIVAGAEILVVARSPVGARVGTQARFRIALPGVVAAVSA